MFVSILMNSGVQTLFRLPLTVDVVAGPLALAQSSLQVQDSVLHARSDFLTEIHPRDRFGNEISEEDEVFEVTNFMSENYPPKFTYQDFGSQLTMELFDPNRFADIVLRSGAQYLVFTSKHHDATYP